MLELTDGKVVAVGRFPARLSARAQEPSSMAATLVVVFVEQRCLHAPVRSGSDQRVTPGWSRRIASIGHYGRRPTQPAHADNLLSRVRARCGEHVRSGTLSALCHVSAVTGIVALAFARSPARQSQCRGHRESRRQGRVDSSVARQYLRTYLGVDGGGTQDRLPAHRRIRACARFACRRSGLLPRNRVGRDAGDARARHTHRVGLRQRSPDRKSDSPFWVCRPTERIAAWSPRSTPRRRRRCVRAVSLRQ